MATEKFPPTIADIREKAEQITSVKETEMSELEAWAIVRKAIGRSNYYAEEEFEKLPEACKMAVGNPSNLKIPCNLCGYLYLWWSSGRRQDFRVAFGADPAHEQQKLQCGYLPKQLHTGHISWWFVG